MNPFAEINQLTNHFTIVGDESWSMERHAAAFVKAFDNLVAHMASQSRANGQETRITLWLFNSRGTARCVIWDLDVLRMPSIAGKFHPTGRTALIETMLKAIKDQRTIPQLHGLHAFFMAALTDGENNEGGSAPELERIILSAPDNETYAAFVPNQTGVFHAKQQGFPASNISVWDATSARGIEEVGAAMRDIYDRFTEGRTRGVHGYSARTGGGLFRVGGFTAADVRASLTPVTPGSYHFLDVRLSDRDPGSDGAQIDRFYERITKRAYPRTRCYYQLGKKKVKVQDYKDVAVEVGGVLYSGTLEEVRSFVGLPDTTAEVTGDMLKPGTFVFIQSTSMNRKLFPGTRLLVFR